MLIEDTGGENGFCLILVKLEKVVGHPAIDSAEAVDQVRECLDMRGLKVNVDLDQISIAVKVKTMRS